MKALILAGGFGTRLRPLSCTRPKLLFPVGNRPLLDWTLEKLASHGVYEVILAVNYMAEVFMRRYGDSKYGMKIHYSKEDRPLRTGGAIKKAEKLIGHEDSFFVLNGDILIDINYKDLMEAHKSKDGLATLALHEVEDASRYGVAVIGTEGRINRFVEKPADSKAFGNLVNAGVYAFEPRIFDYIQKGKSVSIENSVFPRLAEEGVLYGYKFEGIWTDIGKPLDYLKANRLLLDAEADKKRSEPPHFQKGIEIEAPTIIGKNVKIGNKSHIGPHVSIGDNVEIGTGVRIEDSVIFSEAIVSDFTSIKHSIIGENAIIGKWVKIEDYCLIGDHAIILDNVTLTQGVTVCPSKEVSESVLIRKSLM